MNYMIVIFSNMYVVNRIYKDVIFLYLQVVLTSTPDMQCGFSRDLFIQWCQDSRNSIIITSRTSPGTLARALIDNTGQTSITVEVICPFMGLYHSRDVQKVSSFSSPCPFK